MSTNPYQAPSALTEPIEVPSHENFLLRSPYLATWDVLRRHGLKMAACYLWVWVPVGLILAYLDNFIIDEEDLQMSWRLEQGAQLWIGIIADAAIYSIAAASMKAHTSTKEEFTQGAVPSVTSALVIGVVRYWRMWTTRFCSGLILILGLLLLIIPGIFIFVRTVLAEAIAVEENTNGPTSISRSFALTQGRFWPTAGIAGTIVAVYTVTTIGIISVYVPLLLLVDEPFWIMWIDFGVTIVMMIPVVIGRCLIVAWYQTLKLNR